MLFASHALPASTLPAHGFLRLPDVLKVIPVSRSTWYKGISEGKYPQPTHLGPNLSVWKVQEIRDLIEKLGQ